jgi:Xaa-Pro aminopeptidase
MKRFPIGFVGMNVSPEYSRKRGFSEVLKKGAKIAKKPRSHRSPRSPQLATLIDMRPSSQKLLTAADCPNFLVTDLTNIRYLTGIAVSAGCVLVTPRRYILFVDSRYRESAEKTVRGGVFVRDPLDLPKMLQEAKICGFESEDISVARRASWKKKFPRVKFLEKEGIVQEFRRTKEDHELQAMRKAERITRELLRRIPAVLRHSLSELELSRKLLIWALELGADGMAFDSIVGFGTHTSIPHHHPTSRMLKKGHVVQIDLGAKVRGYCSDASEVFFTTRPTPLQERIYGTLVDAQKAALKLIKPGVSNRTLDRAARAVLDNEGLDPYFTHALGHGVGLDIHEGVSISSKAPEQKLLKNEVITVEPGVYFEGCFHYSGKVLNR